mmetsp:Transcript_28796/g.41239  ORF Transcript_28796/g.41239 Transcript_28796/m.41239 type:complete len:182 (+) Transcript_28796:1956-2501(+)
MYSNRIMMVCATYAYLRDQSTDNFRSSKLQEKRQKLQAASMNKKVALVESTYKKMQQDFSKNTANPNGGGGRNGDKNKPMCWKCLQPGIHTGGKDNLIGRISATRKPRPKLLLGSQLNKLRLLPTDQLCPLGGGGGMMLCLFYPRGRGKVDSSLTGGSVWIQHLQKLRCAPGGVHQSLCEV